MIDYEVILDSLEREIRDAKKSLISGVKNIDEAKCMDIIYTLKNNLPDDIKEARLIISQRDSIVNDAIGEANRILEDARQRASQMLDETGIIQHAQTEAGKIVNAANEQAYSLYMNNSRRMDEMLYDIEKGVYDLLTDIRETRRKINDGSGGIN